MKYAVFAALLSAFMMTPAFADDIGIQFDDMKIGTKLVTESRDKKPKRYTETYLGKQGDYHVIEIGKIADDGAAKAIAKGFFDSEGRLIRSEKNGKFSYEHTPFSCKYLLGDCAETYVYANPFKNGKRVTHHKTYMNSIDGDVVTVALKLSDGSYLKIPYQLGAYNFRVSSEYTNALGQVRGFRLIEIVEP